MSSQKNMWNSLPGNVKIDNARYKGEETLFSYTSGKRYIQLTE